MGGEQSEAFQLTCQCAPTSGLGDLDRNLSSFPRGDLDVTAPDSAVDSRPVSVRGSLFREASRCSIACLRSRYSEPIFSVIGPCGFCAITPVTS